MSQKLTPTSIMVEMHQRLLAITNACRVDMHEPYEQGVSAQLAGDHLDNACGDVPETNCDEYVVTIFNEHTQRLEHFNLATLIALARVADVSGVVREPLEPQKVVAMPVQVSQVYIQLCLEMLSEAELLSWDELFSVERNTRETIQLLRLMIDRVEGLLDLADMTDDNATGGILDASAVKLTVYDTDINWTEVEND